MKWTCDEKGVFSLHCGEILLFRGYAQAYHVDKRRIDTRFSSFLGKEETSEGMILTYQADNGLVLRETLTVSDGVPAAKCALSDADGSEV